jgi:hypothetical protein
VGDTPWYRSDPAALEAAVLEAAEVQPHMHLKNEGARAFLTGRFEIWHEDEQVEAFEIEVALSPESPRSLPVVRELGGRIPQDKDLHHVNDDGTLCVLLPDYFLMYHPEGMTLAEFMKGPLRSHLGGQAAVLRGKPWPAGEWAHGLEGVVQLYQQVLGVSDPRKLFLLLQSEASNRSQRQAKCQCGSGKKRRHCHSKDLRRLGRGPSFKSVVHYLGAKLTKDPHPPETHERASRPR